MASVRKYQRNPGSKKGWRIQVSMPRTPEGKQRTKAKIFYPTGVANPWGREGKAQAMQAELEFRDQLGRGDYTDRPRYTLAYAIDKYIRSRTVDTAKEWSPKTEENTVMWRDRIVEHFGEKKRLADVTADDIGAFLGWLKDHGRLSGDKPLTASTVQRCDDVLRAVFAYALEEELIAESPMRKKHRPQREEHTVDPPTKDDVYRLIDALEGTPFWRTLFIVATATGARRGELCALRWGNLDPEHHRIDIRRNRVYSGGKVHEKLPKAGKERQVSATPRVFAELRQFRHHVCNEWGIDEVDPDWYIFADEPGADPVHPERVRRWWETEGRTLIDGMERHTFHELRHYVGTELAAAGLGFADIAEHLGHASPATSARLYAHARKTEGATDAANLL